VPPMEWRPDRRLTRQAGHSRSPEYLEGGEWTMSESTVKPGDTVRVTVTKVLPFGVLVETATGLPGLVKPVGPQRGDVVSVTVTAVDDDEHRFSGTLPAQ
jgi:ribosomal protein S1